MTFGVIFSGINLDCSTIDVILVTKIIFLAFKSCVKVKQITFTQTIDANIPDIGVLQ